MDANQLRSCTHNESMAPSLSRNALQEKGVEKELKVLTYKVVQLLDEEEFRSKDFWEGYKIYCFARYSNCASSRGLFLKSKMGRVLCRIQNEEDFHWGAVSDELVRDTWVMMEEYGTLCYGRNWKNLKSLMEEFDDVKELSRSEKGCLLLQLVEDDDNGNEETKRESLSFENVGTDIFEEMRGRLKAVSSNLGSLMESCTTSDSVKRNRKRKMCTTDTKSDISATVEEV